MRRWLADALLRLWALCETRDLRELALTRTPDGSEATREFWCAWCWRLHGGAQAAQEQIDELMAERDALYARVAQLEATP